MSRTLRHFVRTGQQQGPFCSIIFGFFLGIMVILILDRGYNSIFQILSKTIPPKGPFNIDEIIGDTRNKIKYELSDYNFSASGVQKLEDLLMETGGKPIRNLIVSTWRSGTTFLGSTMNSMPGVFYHCEPVWSYTSFQIREPPVSTKAIAYMKRIFNCDFDEPFEIRKMPKPVFSLIQNTRLWEYCKDDMEKCVDPDIRSKFCKLFPFQNMKTVRVRLELIKPLLDDKDLDLHVVLLIRDPRGVMQSRLHVDFCDEDLPDCSRPDRLCADMTRDYEAAGRLLQAYPGRVTVVRFEELAADPIGAVHRLLKFFRHDVTSAVDEYLHAHTSVADPSHTFSTYRVTQDVPYKWKNVLPFEYVDKIQMVCEEAMKLWGYRIAQNATHMKSKTFNPVGPYFLYKISNINTFSTNKSRT